MYDLGDSVAVGPVDPGTNVLISGPPLTGKRRLAIDVLAHGLAGDDGAIVVTTKDSAEKIQREFGDVIDDPDEANIGIVDCVSKQQGVGNPDDDRRVKYASAPVDMTGIGIKLSEFLEDFSGRRGLEGNRILVDSVSTLLMYSDLQTVFRFLHVFTGRVQSADALGLYVVDSTAHDSQSMNTLKQLFDGIVEVEETDDGGTEISVRGLVSG